MAVKKPRALPTAAQFGYLSRVLNKKERFVFFSAAIIALVSGILLLGSLAIKFRSLAPRAGGTYTEAAIGNPQLINPLWAQANDVDRDLADLIFSGLFRHSSSLATEPDLAESFTVSEDGKTYTVKLRTNLHWSDGESLTAEDILFTIETIQNPAYKSPLISDFRGVKAESSDPQTLVFNLENPSALFPHYLTVGIIPKHIWADVPPEASRLTEFNIKPIGSGPYRFKTLNKTKEGTVHSYVLERNPNYYEQKPYLASIVFRFYADNQLAATALADGNVDGLAFVSRELRPDLTKKQNLKYYPLALPQITALFMNQKQNAILTDKSIREALAQSLDKTKIVNEAFGGEAIIVNGPILPGTVGYTDDVTHFDGGLDKARELLNTAGFKLAEGATSRTFVPKDKSDKRFSRNTELKLKLTTVNSPDYVRAAEIIRASWEELGIKVDLSTVEPAEMARAVITPRDFEVLLYSELAKADGDPYPFWHSSGTVAPGVNLAGYANRRVDALLEEARLLTDETERTKRYVEFQKTVVSELPAIFLASPTYTYAVDERVHGIEIGRLGTPADRFANIANWYVKTKWKFWK